ncbi:hypothetical protein AX14_011527 [Amanita brunnescens Koide BX004]|nr:hypothetical protein AX14_011527 [Amanita brunnescens Koide BX004]
MLTERIVCPPRAGCPFHTTAKRYWLPEFVANQDDPDALTLILLHSTSFHKETWEPTLDQLFQLARRPGFGVKLREAWALDCPNHGEAVLYNENVLRQDEHAEVFTCQKYAHVVYSFLTAGINEGAQTDFGSRRLIGIGHSLGANAMLLAQQYEPRMPFISLVIVEPMVSPQGSEHLANIRQKLIHNAYLRPDVWRSKDEARSHFSETKRCRKWDTRVMDLYVEHGLRPHPAFKWYRAPFHGVTLACTREQEAAMYRDLEGATDPVKMLDQVCTFVPVHLILGRKHDVIPTDVQDELLNPASGRSYASTEYIDDVGHLIPQEKPDALGRAIFATFQLKSRL